MPAKTTTKPKTRMEKTTTPATETTTPVPRAATIVTIAKATVAKGNGAQDNIYEDAVKEIVALSENDTYAKRIDNGALSEARGKDTWRLHGQLRAVDQMDKNLSKHASTLQTALHEVDAHLHEDTVAITNLVTGSRNDIVNEVEALTTTVTQNFNKLAQATAGTEENLRSQTDSFGKAVENLLSTLQHEFDKKITAFQDEATRLIDKRFNQSDVAFAAIRADQEVIKALLTDIIKDRLGRPEPRAR